MDKDFHEWKNAQQEDKSKERLKQTTNSKWF